MGGGWAAIGYPATVLAVQSWGPQPAYFLVTTFQSFPLGTFCIISRVLVVQSREEQKEMGLPHLVPTKSPTIIFLTHHVLILLAAII